MRRLTVATVVVTIALWVTPATALPVLDPVGDTFDSGAIDITSIDAVIGAATVMLTVGFAAPIAPPSAFAANSVIGFIDLDTDENASTSGGNTPWGGPVTGGDSWINFFIPPNTGTPSIPGPIVALGAEFYIDVGSELFQPGLVNVVDPGGNVVVGTGAASFVGSVMTIVFASSLIGSPGDFSYAMVLGNFQSQTDRAPNGESPLSTSPVVAPEPGVLVLLSLGSLAAARARRRRR
jgi:hypothetical protein